jgi:flavin reductase (DIM6/NTAB) family NADH-FMN oxidoreductase RutF
MTASLYEATVLPSPEVPSIDPKWYRQVLGQYPTGVCVITATGSDETPISMVVGSFTSVSLNPALVAFFPDKGSSSWAKLRDCQYFCVNILSSDQESVCRQLASKDPNKFSGVPHRISDRGCPILKNVVAWIECRCFSITDAGDHEMVTGEIIDLDIAGGGLPLLFFQGGYGRFAPGALVSAEAPGLSLAQLRQVDRARAEIERLALETGGRCLATVRAGRELIVAASAGQGEEASFATLVGQRLPFRLPTGSIFAAWLPDKDLGPWLSKQDEKLQESAATVFARVRERGFSVSLINDAQRAFSAHLASAGPEGAAVEALEELIADLVYDPAEWNDDTKGDARVLSAPVFGEDGAIAMALTLYGFPRPPSNGVDIYISHIIEAAARVSESLKRHSR